MLVLTLNPVTSEADHSPHQLELTILAPDACLHPWLEKTKRDQKQGIKPGQKVLRDGPHTVVFPTPDLLPCGTKNQLCGFVCGCPSLHYDAVLHLGSP